MKLLSEIQEWCLGAASQFGDPSAVTGQIFARYVSKLPPFHDDVVVAFDRNQLLITFEQAIGFPLKINAEGPLVEEQTGHLAAFGLEKVSDGLWNLSPSLHIPGVIHAFLTIYDVPKYAPWSSEIIVVSSFSASAFA